MTLPFTKQDESRMDNTFIFCLCLYRNNWMVYKTPTLKYLCE